MVQDAWTTGGGTLSEEITGLTNGLEYDVQVRAENSVGNGDWSATMMGTPATKPGAPSISTVTPGDTKLTVAWNAPSSDGGATITAYDVRHILTSATDKADANWPVVQDAWTTGGGTLSEEITGLTNGLEYDVQVRAENSVGNGDWSATMMGTPATKPGAPSISTVTPGDTKLTVAWNAPSSDGGATITAYDVRHILTSATDKADANWTVVQVSWTTGGGTLSEEITGLTNGLEYDVQVRAENSVGNGDWSATMMGTPAIPKVTVSFGAGSYSVAEGGTVDVEITLSAAPERPVTIPIDKTEQGGAGSADYSGVPASVTFKSGETEQSFTFTATDDTVADSGESVTLSFGTLPTGVSAGAPVTATVSITDNDGPDVTVSFGAADYSATEGGAVEVIVTLSAAPERPVTIPIDKTEQGGAGSADYSGVPASVTFESGETERSFTVTATDDTVADGARA